MKAVMAAMQKDPWVLMAHPDAGVNSLADMKGHPMLLSDASLTGVWVWLKARFGLTDDQVRKYTFNSGPFIQNRAAIQQGYVTSEPYTIEKEGHFKPKVFVLSDEGYPGYADLVLVPDDLIAKNPKAVQAFVEATAAGWKAYLHGDPRPADAMILKDNPEMTQDVLGQGEDARLRDRRWQGLAPYRGHDRRPLAGTRRGDVEVRRAEAGHGHQERLHPAVRAQIVSRGG